MSVHPEAGISVSPRASLVYSPWPQQAFRASIARAFRNPTILENFEALALMPPSRPPTLLLGNPRLQPEEMLSYEVGYQTLLFERLRLKVDLFYNQLDELIAQQEPVPPSLLPPSPPVRAGVQFVNAGSADIWGGEFAAEFFFAPWLQGALNYSYQNRTGFLGPLGLAAHHKGTVGLTLAPANGFSATLLLNYVGEVETQSGPALNPYTMVHTRLGYRFNLFGQQTEVAVQAFNLLNDRHREFPGGDLIERRVSGTVRVRF